MSERQKRTDIEKALQGMALIELLSYKRQLSIEIDDRQKIIDAADDELERRAMWYENS